MNATILPKTVPVGMAADFNVFIQIHWETIALCVQKIHYPVITC